MEMFITVKAGSNVEGVIIVKDTYYIELTDMIEKYGKDLSLRVLLFMCGKYKANYIPHPKSIHIYEV